MHLHCGLIVIGSGPAGERAAIQAARIGKNVLLVENNEIVGGVTVPSGIRPATLLAPMSSAGRSCFPVAYTRCPKSAWSASPNRHAANAASPAKSTSHAFAKPRAVMIPFFERCSVPLFDRGVVH